MMNVTLTNVSVYCTASKRVLQWHIMTAGPSGIMFVEFFHEKYRLAMGKYIMARAHNPPSFFHYALLIMVIPAYPHCVQVPNEKLKK